MIRITRQTDYAFRIILFLAKHPPGTRISSSKIKAETLIPPALSLRIVAELANSGFIKTFPGRDGGIELARQAEDISLWDIFDLFEGPIYISECLITGQECPLENRCPIHPYWEPLQATIKNKLKEITFKKLAEDAETLEFAVPI